MIQLVPDQRGAFWIYEYPSQDQLYVAGIDTAEGRIRDRRFGAIDNYDARDPDFNAISILRLADGIEVATYLSNFAVGVLLDDVMLAARWYGTTSGCAFDCFLVPEINGSGYALTEGLQARHYGRVFLTRIWNHLEQTYQKTLGWRTTPQNRDIMICDLQDEVRAGTTGVRCHRTAKHMAAMSRDRNGSFRAPPGAHDDLAFARMLAMQGRRAILTTSTVPPPGQKPGKTSDEYLAEEVAKELESMTHDRDTVSVEEDVAW